MTFQTKYVRGGEAKRLLLLCFLLKNRAQTLCPGRCRILLWQEEVIKSVTVWLTNQIFTNG